jgi:hypothetical protein
MADQHDNQQFSLTSMVDGRGFGVVDVNYGSSTNCGAIAARPDRASSMSRIAPRRGHLVERGLAVPPASSFAAALGFPRLPR